VNVITHLLAANGPIPNHPRWPLLVYPAVMPLPRPEAFEDLFTRNRWPAAWRNGVHSFHHYHSNSHEALGIYEGEVTVQFGGERGITVTAKPGDVIVLPAGTGHKKLSSRGALGVVGAYPEGSDPDTCMPPFVRARDHAGRVALVELPASDPVHGITGPLFDHWK
jgi:uncharacterized protein YjlB